MDYAAFLNNLDLRLDSYFEEYKDYIYCKIGCSSCCEKGDYPLSDIELQYMMNGYIALENEIKKIVHEIVNNIYSVCFFFFLIDKKCSIYPYRPIICRVHGLAYLCRTNTVKVPHCVKENKNFSKVFQDGEIIINPIKENLDTPEILKNFKYGEIRNLYDWLNHSPGFSGTDG